MTNKIEISHKDLRFVLCEVGLKSKQTDMVMAIIKKEYETECLDCQGEGMVTVASLCGKHPHGVTCKKCKGSGVVNEKSA